MSKNIREKYVVVEKTKWLGVFLAMYLVVSVVYTFGFALDLREPTRLKILLYTSFVVIPNIFLTFYTLTQFDLKYEEKLYVRSR